MQGFIRVLSLVGALLCWGHAERVTDRLHGFSLDVPEGWEVVLADGGLFVTNLESVVLVRGMPLKPPPEAVRPLLEEVRYLSGGRGIAYFKPASGGLLLLAQGLGYPVPLVQGALRDLALFLGDPQVQAFLSGLRYEAAHLLLPGPRSLLVVSAYLPQDLSPSGRREVLGLLRSLEFLGPDQRVPYQVSPILDPALDIPAGYVPVPQGYSFQGGVASRGGELRSPVFQVAKGEVALRVENIYLNAMAVSGPFGGNATTLLLWNGRLAQVQGFLCARGPEEVPALLAQGLWAWETRAPWQVQKANPFQGQSRVAWYLEQARETWERQMDQMLLLTMGRTGDQFHTWRARLFLEASQGFFRRQGVVEATGTFRYSPSFAASTGDCHLYLQLSFLHGPPQALDREAGVLTGILLGYKPNPEWLIREAERARQASAEQTRMVLQMLRQGQEFNTWMSRSWTNLLSDQTYARDPATGETFRLYKRSFETGGFWREPVFGGVLGGVERGGKLEELLRSEGWRRLEESLSGLPGTWR